MGRDEGKLLMSRGSFIAAALVVAGFATGSWGQITPLQQTRTVRAYAYAAHFSSPPESQLVQDSAADFQRFQLSYTANVDVGTALATVGHDSSIAADQFSGSLSGNTHVFSGVAMARQSDCSS